MNLLNHILLIKKFPSWIYKLGSQLYMDTEFPRHIHIETTTRCNLKCKMCPRPKIEKDMDIIIFKMIIDEVYLYGARSFSLHLFGEPLMDKLLLDRIEYIKGTNKKNNIVLTTNGTMLNEKVFDMVDKIILSYRGQNLGKFLPWEKKITLRIFNGIVQPVEGWNMEYKDYHNYGGNILDEVGGSSRYQMTWYPCYHLWLAPAIAWNGDILICCNDVLHKTKIGNIKNMSLHKAWTSSYMEDLRQLQLRGITMGICSKCNCYKTYPNMWWKWQMR